MDHLNKEVNTFLPWHPLKDRNEAKNFYEKRLKDKKYCFAICLKDQDSPHRVCTCRRG